MGVVAPLTIDSGLRARIDADIVAPTIASLKRKGFVYRGILYFGLMITADGPSLLEYNVRFGDPEAQALLPLLDGDWAQVFLQLADGRLTKLKWKSSASACLVLAAEGYPDAPVKGAVISGLGAAANAGAAYALHAGTRLSARGEWETSGGRVVNVIGLGRDIREALTNAYEKAATIKWFGRQMRKDIGEKQITKPSAG
jgi:phosphoribosylamine--glycine ligase